MFGPTLLTAVAERVRVVTDILTELLHTGNAGDERHVKYNQGLALGLISRGPPGGRGGMLPVCPRPRIGETFHRLGGGHTEGAR